MIGKATATVTLANLSQTYGQWLERHGDDTRLTVGPTTVGHVPRQRGSYTVVGP